MRVMKFGGTSLATSQRLDTVCTLIRDAAESEQVVVVTSAPAGVTDLLEGLTNGAPSTVGLKGPPPLSALEALISELMDGLPDGGTRQPGGEAGPIRTGLDYVLSEVEGIVFRSARKGAWEPSLKDRVLGAGERISAHLLVSLLESRGIPSQPLDAGELVRTDSEFGGAAIDMAVSVGRIRRSLGRLRPGVVAVIPGFTGGDVFRQTTTLGRGTSDLTASLVGAAMSARVVEIWTDVDGIHAEDPARRPTSPVLPHLHYDQARKMAETGARVLHPRTLDPIQPLGIPLQVRNTLRPDGPGTRVGPKQRSGSGGGADGEAPAGKSSRCSIAAPRGRTVVRLVLAGATGRVAGALLDQLRARGDQVRKRTGFDLRICGAFNSRTQVWSPLGLPPGEIPERLRQGPPADWGAFMGELTSGHIENPVFVDLTASPRIARGYQEILDASVPLVTANKLALSGSLSDYRRLQAAAVEGRTSFRYETTVGAALPVIGAVRNRHRTGDGLVRLEAALSGTLAFVFSRLAEGVPFSRSVTEAKALGYTEPDPREDLGGADVGRKLLILLREAGFALEPHDIPVESLVPPELAILTEAEAFLDALSKVDGLWTRRSEEAAKRGERLVYAASLGEGGPQVGVRCLPEDHPLARLGPGENLLLFTTDRYPTTPLSISGPGAGPVVTASGVLADILSAAGRSFGAEREVREWGPVAPGERPPGGGRVT